MVYLFYHYSRERSPLWVVALLSFVLFFAGTPTFAVDPWGALRGWISAGLLLLLARISDDMADIPIDRITHPGRLLSRADRATLRQMRGVQLGLIGLLLGLQWLSATVALFILAVLAVYGVFFAIKHRFSIIVQSVVVNSTLGVLPIYAELARCGQISGAGLLMGLFFWLGALAHDYSHSILDARDESPERLSPMNRLDAKRLAIASLILFLTSGAVGLLLYGLHYTGPLFLALLLVCLVVMTRLEVRLIRRPGRATAKPFYWFGYVFFLLPALGYIVSQSVIGDTWG